MFVEQPRPHRVCLLLHIQASSSHINRILYQDINYNLPITGNASLPNTKPYTQQIVQDAFLFLRFPNLFPSGVTKKENVIGDLTFCHSIC